MISVRKAVQEDYFRVLKIGDEQLGNDYLKGVLLPSSEKPLWVAEDRTTGKVVGFIYLIFNAEVATIKSIAIDEGYQNKGVGTQLIETVLANFYTGFEYFEVIAWERSDTGQVPLENLLKRIGFDEQKRKRNFWHEDSILRGYTCPSCGNPCNCNAVIFNIPSSYFAKSNGSQQI